MGHSQDRGCTFQWVGLEWSPLYVHVTETESTLLNLSIVTYMHYIVMGLLVQLSPTWTMSSALDLRPDLRNVLTGQSSQV